MAEMTWVVLIGLVLVAGLIGAFYGGFRMAARNPDQKGYVLRGLFWSLLFFLGGLMLAGALVFGACLVMVSRL
jgi:hypothetical protein